MRNYVVRERIMKRLFRRLLWLRHDVRGAVFVEYLLLLTLVGIGVICGLAALKGALVEELGELAAAIGAITCPP
jgi:Flp pilus assembly pilin Flp